MSDGEKNLGWYGEENLQKTNLSIHTGEMKEDGIEIVINKVAAAVASCTNKIRP